MKHQKTNMKYITVSDIVIFVVLVLVVFITLNLGGKKDKSIIEINTSDKSYRYTLEEDRTLEIEGLHGVSIIEIKDAKVCFLASPCPDKLCIKDGMLKNKPLICMVNAVIVRYSSNKASNNNIDSIGY